MTQPNNGRLSRLKAPAAQHLKLVDLQAVDTRLDQLRHRLRNLPEGLKADECQNAYDELEVQLGQAQASASDIKREVTRAETEVDQVKQRIDKDQGLLDSGTISQSKQLEELQHEIESLNRRLGILEDAQLEVMERGEEAENLAQSLTERAARAEAELSKAKADRDSAKSEIEANIEEAVALHEEIAGDISSAELLALYNKIRESQGGVAAALLDGDTCASCNMTFSSGTLSELRAKDPDEVSRCETCRAILVVVGGSK